MYRHLFVASLFVTLVLLTGCGQTPPPPVATEDTQARPPAIPVAQPGKFGSLRQATITDQYGTRTITVPADDEPAAPANFMPVVPVPPVKLMPPVPEKAPPPVRLMPAAPEPLKFMPRSAEPPSARLKGKTT
jgi:hypothetical protein